MEQAGAEVARIARSLISEFDLNGTVLILCGAGNNGGDGLVAARHLAAAGTDVRVCILAPESKLREDAATNLKRLKSDTDVKPVVQPKSPEVDDGVGLVIDALLGTGSTGALREPYTDWLAVCNKANVPVLSVDAPSGVDLDTGDVEGEAFHAVATVALGELKPGYFGLPGRTHTGRVYPVDIGLPADATAGVSNDLYLITPEGVAALLPERPPDGHKGTFGRVAVVGASTGMTGAAVLASLAALRTGCGLVALGVPKSLNAICEGKATEVVTHPLPEVKDKGVCALRAKAEILKMVDGASALVLGCGMGRHRQTLDLIGRLVAEQPAPLVLDADGLYPFGDDPDRLVRHRAPMIITPHPGELAHLLGEDIEFIQADRVGAARRAARHFDCVCVLKGALTVVATVTGQAYINPSGNAGMGTAGSGDVLAGIIGSLVAQGASMSAAATAGAYIHGLAGDQAAQLVGERALIASDLLESLPEAMTFLELGTWPEYF
jgi:NAD(P)H-hydrate epimerase